jgi:hypothetical protein
MSDLRGRPFRHAVFLFAGFALASALLLWVWNTLAHDLFGGPEAQFRHAVAAVLLCAIAMAVVRRRHSRDRELIG